ncbi:MAG: type II toxin-antitoxin system VapC family toxin [Deltaproteobacteria bacterium]|nr:type II toxin-antitoxin system VapC family toxin [Deltaproteobacteria bacterium]
MKKFVVDASVAIKWYLPEEHNAAAERLLNQTFRLHVPDLFFPETGNILWKRLVREEISKEKACTILKLLESAPIKVWESKPLLPEAFNIAVKAQRTVYDSLYIALAISEGCRMVTADRKLYNSLHNGTLKNTVLWVEDIP